MSRAQRHPASVRWLVQMTALLAGLGFWNPEGVRAANDDLEVAEATLREHLVNMLVQIKIDMPANEDGIDVRSWAEPPIDVQESQKRIDEYGFSIASSGLGVITDVKRKRRHIEVHLNGGGWSGRVPSLPQLADKSAEEISLGLPGQSLLSPASPSETRRRSAELVEERTRKDDRAYEDYLRALDEYERNKIAAGSRFNIRYRRALTARELTPESVMEALSDYVDFGVD